MGGGATPHVFWTAVYTPFPSELEHSSHYPSDDHRGSVCPSHSTSRAKHSSLLINVPSLQGSSPGQAIRATSPAVPQALLYVCVKSRSRLLASIGSSLAWESREEKHTIVVPCLAARERASSFHPQCFLNLSSAAPKKIFYQKLKVSLPEDSLGGAQENISKDLD